MVIARRDWRPKNKGEATLQVNITIYCDGSYSSQNKTGGWGAVISFRNRSYYHHGCCNNLTHDIHECELRAIVKAIGKIKAVKKRRVTIYTDRITLVDDFRRYMNYKRSRKLKRRIICNELWNIIEGYTRQFPITIVWVSRKNNIAHKYASTYEHKQNTILSEKY
jgi:Ribonuclease HI